MLVLESITWEIFHASRHTPAFKKPHVRVGSFLLGISRS